MSAPEAAQPTTFGGASPIFRVGSLRESIDYYVNALGFTVGWEYPGVVASVVRGRVDIFLSEGDQGNPGAWAWVGVDDVERLFDEYRRSGARIRQPPTNFSWALEMQVEDLDGNVLRLGSEPKEDQPFGPWKDMRGDLWVHESGDRWYRADPQDAR